MRRFRAVMRRSRDPVVRQHLCLDADRAELAEHLRWLIVNDPALAIDAIETAGARAAAAIEMKDIVPLFSASTHAIRARAIALARL
jgi:hypothetical protein